MSPTLLEIARAMAEPLTFRAKVWAMIDEEVRLAVAAEREACAKVAEDFGASAMSRAPEVPSNLSAWSGGEIAMAKHIAAAIRARGEAVKEEVRHG